MGTRCVCAICAACCSGTVCHAVGAAPACVQPNPYHSATHAAGVLQVLHMILHQATLGPGILDWQTLLACYLAAIVHDFEWVQAAAEHL